MEEMQIKISIFLHASYKAVGGVPMTIEQYSSISWLSQYMSLVGMSMVDDEGKDEL
jgi:hypothetical protein